MDDDEVGYCRPPRHTQWEKGVSGNPRGRRPKATGRRGILLRIASELHNVRVGEKLERMNMLTAVVMAVRNATANGNHAAQKLMDTLLNELPETEPLIPRAVFICGEELTSEEWVEKFSLQSD